jgi:hypothetical protein
MSLSTPGICSKPWGGDSAKLGSSLGSSASTQFWNRVRIAGVRDACHARKRPIGPGMPPRCPRGLVANSRIAIAASLSILLNFTSSDREPPDAPS